LVTALQLVIVDILEQWGVTPESVIGHSSGEIAAAYTAGFISKEDAITAAYYRGYASARDTKGQELGMLAAGISASEFATYARDMEDSVTIACFNSPQSITISGPVAVLQQIRDRLVDDDKFARLLQVNSAYHSKFMNAIGEDYHALLSASLSGHTAHGDIQMFSSVSGQLVDRTLSADYWTSNMIKPVRFDQAVRAMLLSHKSPDFLIEIGPSGALAGPIKQILTHLGDEAAKVQYCAALSRGRDAIKSLYDTAGKLFVAGGSIDLAAVNQLGRSGEEPPCVIVDLPNYAWNYAVKYWYENDASKDWRFRMFPHHDLLGTKTLGSPWNEPSFKKKLSLEHLPWLRDHKVRCKQSGYALPTHCSGLADATLLRWGPTSCSQPPALWPWRLRPLARKCMH
jgi:acyl transferase domain-containing protein